MTESQPAAPPFAGRTAWARNLQTPLRAFLRTQTGSAAVLLAMALLALAWVNADASSYETVWHTQLSIRVGAAGVSQDLRGWVNSGLMTFFFFIVGLEARREFDIGELRERRRLALPVVAGLGGMVIPVAIYLAANAGRSSARGWGAAMSTDTAFALGMLALVGSRLPDRLRAFILTVAVVDDLVSLVVIGIAYSGNIVHGRTARSVRDLRRDLAHPGRPCPLRVRLRGWLGIAAWTAMFKSGVDPVVVGLAMGLLTYAYPASRTDLERATDLFRNFREQPTPELARSASIGLTSAISPNDRLQQLYHPVDELRHRAALRARQRGDRDQRRFPGTRLHLTDHAGDPFRLCGGQAHRDRRRDPAGHPAEPRPAAPARRLGRRRRRRHDRGHRLHGVLAHRDPRLPRHPARGGEARCPQRGRVRVPRDVARLPRHRAASAQAADPRIAWHLRGHRRSRRTGRSGS